jgi:hypothetical protein
MLPLPPVGGVITLLNLAGSPVLVLQGYLANVLTIDQKRGVSGRLAPGVLKTALRASVATHRRKVREEKTAIGGRGPFPENHRPAPRHVRRASRGRRWSFSDGGVLTPEMAQRLLPAKADRDAKWARAMELWAKTPDPRAEIQQENTTGRVAK